MNSRFSALQRAENSSIHNFPDTARWSLSFSALQRAENSSICLCSRSFCTSPGFSALQRAENSSIYFVMYTLIFIKGFQCSSASRKFLNFFRPTDAGQLPDVSVLFSEPKIPQLSMSSSTLPASKRFSALQRAENSSMQTPPNTNTKTFRFQCSSASRKFLNKTIQLC